jgi:DNA-directed RNA polymerase specialized sigma subunit
MNPRTKIALRQRRDAANFERARVAMRTKIKTFARNSFFHVPGFTEEDMEQELLLVLLAAVKAYDPAASTFNNFAQQCFRYKIGSLRREAGAQKRAAEIVSIDVEAVQIALDARRSDSSAEEWALAREVLREEWDSATVRMRIRAAG